MDGTQHAIPISSGMEYTIQGNLEFVIVVEKDTVFDTLRSSMIWTRLPCVLITGRGKPDEYTRYLVSSLAKRTHATVVYLGDWNPHGMEIYLCYRIGSYEMAYASENLVANVRWLGLCARHIVDLIVRVSYFAPHSFMNIVRVTGRRFVITV